MLDLRSKILIVDDEQLNIELLTEGLQDDYHIITTMKGGDVIELAIKHFPDLILLDIHLGELCGLDICTELKHHSATKHIPIMFITAADSYEDELKGLELGAIDYIKKPFLIPLVKVRVRNQIELKRKTDMLERLSSVDSLTSLANRRQFDNYLKDYVSHASRHERGINLLMIDIDRFKQYNDIYGHVKGDDTLRSVAKMLRLGASRPMDFVARYGGEEFVVLLNDSSPKEGALLGEKLREAVESLCIEHEGSEYGVVTISIGVAHLDGKLHEDIDDLELIRQADKCLYQAKESGRNRVITESFEIKHKNIKN